MNNSIICAVCKHLPVLSLFIMMNNFEDGYIHVATLDFAQAYIHMHILIYGHLIVARPRHVGLHGNAWLPCSPLWVLQLFCHPKYIQHFVWSFNFIHGW